MVEGLKVENVEPQPLNILNPQHSQPLNILNPQQLDHPHR